MQATSAQNLSNPRATVLAVLAAGIFAVGAALGAVAGTAVATRPASVGAIQSTERDVSGLQLQRRGEIGTAGVPTLPDALHLHRLGEMTIGSAAAGGSGSTGPRSQVRPGK